MKYIRFSINGVEKYGILDNKEVIELKENFLENKINKTGIKYMLKDIEIQSPVRPGKIIVIGLNYIEHAQEVNVAIPEEPMMFMVSPSSIIAHNEEIEIPFLEHDTHYEAELAIVIGKKTEKIKKEDALNYIFGYTIANDVSDRNLQKKDIQLTRAKSYNTFKPLGPIIETDINPNNLEIKLTLNGDVKQHSNTKNLVFNIENLIEKISSVMTLNPGDIILTGTPAGVGSLKPDDQVNIEIEGIGMLTNKVKSINND